MKSSIENKTKEKQNSNPEIKNKKIRKNSFRKDILILLLISIFIGSVLAGAVSITTNSYFSRTVSNLVGDYGEHDVIINTREEMREDSLIQIQKIIAETLPGAKLKEGTTITGKTSFFISLPDEYKTKEIFENLGKIFGGIPGGAGVGVISEPRLIIRGVPEGAKVMVKEKLEQMEGVKFAFRDGSSIGVMLTSLEQTGQVSSKIKTFLNDYQIIEISFPVGSEPQNPVKLGENVAEAIEKSLKLPYAKSVSTDEKNDDMAYLVSTMAELKKFLLSYRTQVDIDSSSGEAFSKGDKIIFQGKAKNALEPGGEAIKGNVVVEIESTFKDGAVKGRVLEGDASWLKNEDGVIQKGYRFEKNLVTSSQVEVAYKNPREELGDALFKAGQAAGQIPGFLESAKDMGNIALETLDNYDDSLQAIEKILDGLNSAGNTITTATSSISNFNTAGLQYQLDSSSKTLAGVINALQLFKLVNADVSDTVDSLAVTRKNIDNVKTGLKKMENTTATAKQAKVAIDTIVANGKIGLNALRVFDVGQAKETLLNIDKRLNAVENMNIPLIAVELEYLSKVVPDLKDEDINHSIDVLDKVVSGKAIPGARLQILTISQVNAEALVPVITENIGHDNLAVYSNALGVIEPNTRGEVQQMLRELKSILAAMTAIIITLILLGLDHTAVMTFIKRERLNKSKKSVFEKKSQLLFGRLAGGEKCYAMLVGAVMLTGMFIMSGGGLPYLPWIGVPVLGAFLGLIAACYCEKISPVSAAEVMAGEALGLSTDEIMREIIIPSGRPGLMQKLNSRKIKFK